jgi:hypothetical protein
MAEAGVQLDIAWDPKWLRGDNPPNIDKAVAAAAGRLADDIVRDAKRIVPTDTWALHDSIEGNADETGSIRIVAGDEDVDYAAHVEYGTSNDDGSQRMAAQPYLRPAAYKQRGILR